MEALPQSFLQTSIGVMYGMLEPGCGKRSFLSRLYFKTNSDRLGTNIGKALKKGSFL